MILVINIKDSVFHSLPTINFTLWFSFFQRFVIRTILSISNLLLLLLLLLYHSTRAFRYVPNRFPIPMVSNLISCWTINSRNLSPLAFARYMCLQIWLLNHPRRTTAAVRSLARSVHELCATRSVCPHSLVIVGRRWTRAVFSQTVWWSVKKISLNSQRTRWTNRLLICGTIKWI